MRAERLAGIAHLAADRATLAARTDHAIAGNADVRNPVGVVERVNAYGMQPNVMPRLQRLAVVALLRLDAPRIAHRQAA